jgi:hypothetical protein
MTRYEKCLHSVRAYVRGLQCNSSAVEGLVRSYVEQPGFDVTFREQLIRDALTEKANDRTIKRPCRNR